MLFRCSIGALALVVAQSLTIAGAGAFDDTKYPDWKGQWVRIGPGAFDPTKPGGAVSSPR